MNIVYIGTEQDLAHYVTACNLLVGEETTYYKFNSHKYLDYEEYHEPIDEDRLHEQVFALLRFTALLIVVFILRILYKFHPETIKIRHLYEQKDFH